MTIHKKLFRDLYEHKGANIAAMIVIAIGIMMYTGASIALDTLVYSRELFYRQGNFPQAYAEVIAISEEVVSDLSEIEGIADSEARLVQDVKTFGSGPTIRLISESRRIGRYLLHSGRPPIAGNKEVLLDQAFAQANGWNIGDSLTVITGGKVYELTVCGLASSPELIYSVKDISSLLPDPKSFGVAFIDRRSLQTITAKQYFNTVLLQLDEGVCFEKVKNTLEKAILPYGLLHLYPLEDQSSEVMLSSEIEEQEALMITMPFIFLSVAVLVMSIMIKRIIEQQRGQIGILKAFGYSDFDVGFHYASYCLLIGIAGGVIGGILGIYFYELMISLYRDLFNMRFFTARPIPEYFVKGLLLSCAFSVATGIYCSMKAVRILPSEAMRAEAPKGGKKAIIESLPFFSLIFSSKGKMSVRNIFRNGRRSLFIVLGLSLAFAVSILPWTMLSLFDSMVFDRYTYTEKYDVKIFLNGLHSKTAAENALRSFPGVLDRHGIAEIPTTLSRHGVRQDVSVVGISSENRLYTLVDEKKRPVPVKKGGIILSELLADKLGAEVGDPIEIKSPYARYKEDSHTLYVSSIIRQGIGMNGYMDIDFLSEVLGYSSPICSALLLGTENEETLDLLRERYEDSEHIMNIQAKDEAIGQILSRMDLMYSAMYFMALIASVMSFSIIYNTFVVILLERQREFSTLMVLGMEDREVLSILSLEQWMTGIAGMIAGAPIAKAMILIMSRELSTDSFTMPTDMSFHAVLIASLLMCVSILAAQLLASKKIYTVDIVEVLKSGE